MMFWGQKRLKKVNKKHQSPLAQPPVMTEENCVVAFVTQVHVNTQKNFGIHSITMAGPVAAQSRPVLGGVISQQCCQKSDPPFNFASIFIFCFKNSEFMRGFYFKTFSYSALQSWRKSIPHIRASRLWQFLKTKGVI